MQATLSILPRVRLLNMPEKDQRRNEAVSRLAEDKGDQIWFCQVVFQHPWLPLVQRSTLAENRLTRSFGTQRWRLAVRGGATEAVRTKSQGVSGKIVGLLRRSSSQVRGDLFQGTRELIASLVTLAEALSPVEELLRCYLFVDERDGSVYGRFEFARVFQREVMGQGCVLLPNRHVTDQCRRLCWSMLAP